MSDYLSGDLVVTRDMSGLGELRRKLPGTVSVRPDCGQRA